MRHFFWSDIFTWLSFIDEKENVADDILTLWQTGKCCLTVPIKSKNCICLVCSLEVPWPFTSVHLQFHHQPQTYIDSRQLLCQSVLSYKFWVSVCNLEAKLEDHPQDESGSAQFRCKVLRPLLEDFQCKKPECEATDRQLKGATPAKSPANLSSFASFLSLSSSIILRSIHADILTEWSFQKAKTKQQQHWKCCKDAQTDNSEIDLSQFYLVHIFSFCFFHWHNQIKVKQK